MISRISIIFLSVALFAPTAFAQSPNEFSFADGQTYFQAEALFLRRDNQLSNQAVVIDDATLATRLSTRSLGADTGVGQRFLLGRLVGENSAVEVSYFGINDWQSSASVADINNLDIPPALVVPASDFDNADAMRVTNSSDLHNVELNWWQTISGTQTNGTSLLFGARYLHFADEFNINSTDDDGTISDYNLRARNNLFGAQVGARSARNYEYWGWDATGKAGLFGNAAEQSQFVGDNGNLTTLRDTSSSQGAVAFVGDLNASLILHLTKTWSLRGGYNLMWIEGVALGGNQLDFTFDADSGTNVSRSGGVFLHGANVGLHAGNRAHPARHSAPTRHRPHAAHRPPQRHRPPPHRRAWACD